MFETTVLAGGAEFGQWPDGSDGSRLFRFELADLLAAGTPLSGWDRGALVGPSLFEPLPGNRLVELDWDTQELRVTPYESGALGAASVMARGGVFTSAIHAGATRVGLVHPRGVLVLE
jgi:hypothetical protein